MALQILSQARLKRKSQGEPTGSDNPPSTPHAPCGDHPDSQHELTSFDPSTGGNQEPMEIPFPGGDPDIDPDLPENPLEDEPLDEGEAEEQRSNPDDTYETDSSKDQGEVSGILHILENRAKKVLKWESLLAMFLTSGYGNFTSDQFALVKEIVTSSQSVTQDGSRMPSYKTTQESIWKEIQRVSFPASCTVLVGEFARPRSGVKHSKYVKTTSGIRKDPRDCARVVLPSEWARIDVQSRPFFDEVYTTSSEDIPDCYTIEASPMARARDVCLLKTLRLWVLRDGLVTKATVGEKVTFECHKFPETADNQT